MTGLKKSFCPSISKGLHMHFNPSQNVSTILLRNSLMIVTNEGPIVLQMFRIRKHKGIFALISHVSYIPEITQTL